ncbi:rcc01693 family protein [Planktotalea sp.]|uniref:rcc01693 family protein n=1 Tax=Planktotalea sp. TaxID=2029877 RepID=UPI003F6C3466
MSAVNWPQLIRAGMSTLRLRPETFWSLTPSELMVMLGHGGGDAPMGRARLSDLLRLYPDDKRGLDRKEGSE